MVLCEEDWRDVQWLSMLAMHEDQSSDPSTQVQVPLPMHVCAQGTEIVSLGPTGF